MVDGECDTLGCSEDAAVPRKDEDGNIFWYCYGCDPLQHPKLSGDFEEVSP